MLNFDKISKQKKNFSRLTGVTIKEFQEIVQKARPYWDKLMSKKGFRPNIKAENIRR